jgi:rhodanese-related sulfurtransferase
MRIPLFALSLGLATLTCTAQTADPITGLEHAEAKDMLPAELSKALGTPNLFIFDCNEEDMYAEAHVPGARLIVYDEVTADKLPADKDATLVFYCYNPECPASHTAAQSAIKLGYTRVHYMLAGITGWQDAGLPTEP